MAGIDPSNILRDTRLICEELLKRRQTGFLDQKFFDRVDDLIDEGEKSLGVICSGNPVFSLRNICQELKRRSFENVPIPVDFLEKITVFNQEAMACLRESQAQFGVWQRENTMKQMCLFLWQAFYILVFERIDADYRERFSLYNTGLYDKDHARDVRAQDIREKLQAFHDMLKSSWTHLVPPRMQDINFPDSHLENDMLMEEGSEWWGIPPVTGFVEPPTLKPDAVPLSIFDYFASECTSVDVENERVCHDRTVANFVKYAREPDFYDWCNPFERDTTFLSDLMERYGSTTYPEICRMFPRLLSDYHPTE
jgi:hypothetical protein